MKVLIVEDDINISKMIEVTLSMNQYECSVCHNGKEVPDRLEAERYDLILLDVMLPGADGFSIMEQIEPKKIPVIFLTAKDNVMDKVRGLRLGAEDYIVKPFDAMELLARIEVVLRRCKKEELLITFGSISVDVEKHLVKKDGKDIVLTPKEFDVFVFLLKQQDIVVRKERLMSEIWGFDFMGETRTVDTHIQNIRRKLGLQDILLTIPKVGYRLIKG